MKFSAQSVLLLLSLPILWSCSLLPNRPEPPAVHDFGPFSPITTGYPWTQAEVIAPDWLQDSQIHYRLLYARSTEVRSYSRDSWVAPPAVLLAQRFNGSQRSGNYRLHIELQSFEQIFERPGHSRVVLTFRAAADPSDKRGPVTERDFHFALPTPTADAPGALQTFPRLIKLAENALREWVLTL
jgi:cholesterol transport system auxiliary component